MNAPLSRADFNGPPLMKNALVYSSRAYCCRDQEDAAADHQSTTFCLSPARLLLPSWLPSRLPEGTGSPASLKPKSANALLPPEPLGDLMATGLNQWSAQEQSHGYITLPNR